MILTFRIIQHCSLDGTYLLHHTFLTSWFSLKGSIHLLKYIDLIKLLRVLQRMDGIC
jgi:hypothetical protein